jgi:hypothetical protein
MPWAMLAGPHAARGIVHRLVLDCQLGRGETFAALDTGVQRPVEEPRLSSSQNILHQMPMHVGQAVIAAGVAEGQLLVVETQRVQDHRVEVGHRDFVVDDVVAKLIGLTIGHTTADAARNTASPVP